MNELLSAAANVGFPVVVSIFLLVRVESKLDALTLSIHELAKSIRQP